jgi:hypothetical protein
MSPRGASLPLVRPRYAEWALSPSSGGSDMFGPDCHSRGAPVVIGLDPKHEGAFMDARSNRTSPAELASEASSLLAGLGILSVALFPFALPGLVLALVLVLPLIVLAPPALAIWLLVRGVVRLVGRARPISAGNQADARREPRQITVWTGTSSPRRKSGEVSGVEAP